MPFGRILACSVIVGSPAAIERAYATSASPLTVHRTENFEKSLRQSLEEISAKHHLTKAWLYVGQEGSALANIAVNADPNAPVVIGSLSKSITAIAIGQLLQSGQISLSSKLGNLLAGLYAKHGRIMNASTADITVADLLTHTAGLRVNKASDPEHGISTGDIFVKLNEHPTEFDFLEASDADQSQGTGKFTYSNYSYFMLGLVIEAVTAKTYESYCQYSILRKIGIEDASLIGGKFQAVPSYTGWMMTTADVANVWRHAFDIRHPTLLKANTIKSTLFADIGAPLGAKKDVRYTLGAWIRKGSNPSSPYRLWHNGIQLDYYSYAEDTVPGQIWVFASQAVPESEKEREQVNNEIRNALKAAGIT